MTLKKFLRKRTAQSMVEYMLLVAISVIALLSSTLFLSSGPLKAGLNSHFTTFQNIIKVYP